MHCNCQCYSAQSWPQQDITNCAAFDSVYPDQFFWPSSFCGSSAPGSFFITSFFFFWLFSLAGSFSSLFSAFFDGLVTWVLETLDWKDLSFVLLVQQLDKFLTHNSSLIHEGSEKKQQESVIIRGTTIIKEPKKVLNTLGILILRTFHCTCLGYDIKKSLTMPRKWCVWGEVETKPN